jgi:metal-responsive CopG/Arc/MetJ family transcriptional regulator
MLAVAKKSEPSREESDTTEQVCVRYPNALLDRLDRIAEPFGLRRSDLLRTALMEYVQRQEALQHQQQPRPPRR